MSQVKTYSKNGKATGTAELNPAVFTGTVNEAAVHAVVTGQLRNRRQGTAKTKERGEIAYSNNKPWRQKGTGRARAGDRKSPVWRGGGTVFGPNPRNWNRVLPLKLRRRALQSILQDRADQERLFVVEDVPFTEPKTKAAAEWLRAMGAEGTTLLVTAEPDQTTYLSVRNLPEVSHTFVGQLSATDLAAHKTVVLTAAALTKLEQVLS